MTTQLSAQDAQFLYAQAGNVLTHVMSISLYDPATAAGGRVRFKDLVRHITSRVSAAPVYRRRLHRLPLDVDFPYWVEDTDLDAAAHVTRVRLARPGSWPQFCTLAARHFGREMDMTRPLWDIVVVEGLDAVRGVAPGSYALLQRFHHAAIDGTSGAYALTALCDRDAHGTPAIAPRPARAASDAVPKSPTIVSRAVSAHLTSPLRIAGAVLKLSPTILAAARKQPPEAEAAGKGGIPLTRFNAGISPYRAFAAVEFSLADLAAIRAVAEGATINDVILAICSGGLRKYLVQHDELPGETLVAVAPINTRASGSGDEIVGNDLSAMTVQLSTHIEDPIRRLQAIRDYTRAAKQSKAGISTRVMADLLREIPGAPLAGLTRLLASERFARLYANLFITNVRGPSEPLYMHGARLTHQFGMGPLTHGMGLFIAATTYAGTVSIAATADRQLVPDLGFFGDCLESSFAELRESRKAGAKRRAAGKSGRKLRPEPTRKKRK